MYNLRIDAFRKLSLKHLPVKFREILTLCDPTMVWLMAEFLRRLLNIMFTRDSYSG